MFSLFVRRSSLSLQPWFLLLLAAYAVLELSFNHRLLDLAGSAWTAAAAAQLQDLEQWARVVSGLGLALLLMRCLEGAIASRLLLVLLSASVGLLIMWHLQKAVVDAIVARASAEDLAMSVHAQLSTAEALKGRIELRGQPVLSGPVPDDLRPAMNALWSSSVLGLAPQDLEPTSGVAQLLGQGAGTPVSLTQRQDAYRKAVVTPVALGASLLFGLLNLCQLFAGLSLLLLARLGLGSIGVQRGLLPAWLLVCGGLSLWPSNEWVQSTGYSQVARPALWQAKPFLAPFVDWSVRAEPAWANPVAWVHQELLRDFDFKAPWRP